MAGWEGVPSKPKFGAYVIGKMVTLIEQEKWVKRTLREGQWIQSNGAYSGWKVYDQLDQSFKNVVDDTGDVLNQCVEER